VAPYFYPAVEEGKARLRFFVSCAHTEAELLFTANALKEEFDLICAAVPNPPKLNTATFVTDGSAGAAEKAKQQARTRVSSLSLSPQSASASSRRDLILSRSGLWRAIPYVECSSSLPSPPARAPDTPFFQFEDYQAMFRAAHKVLRAHPRPVFRGNRPLWRRLLLGGLRGGYSLSPSGRHGAGPQPRNFALLVLLLVFLTVRRVGGLLAECASGQLESVEQVLGWREITGLEQKGEGMGRTE